MLLVDIGLCCALAVLVLFVGYWLVIGGVGLGCRFWYLLRVAWLWVGFGCAALLV